MHGKREQVRIRVKTYDNSSHRAQRINLREHHKEAPPAAGERGEQRRAIRSTLAGREQQKDEGNGIGGCSKAALQQEMTRLDARARGEHGAR